MAKIGTAHVEIKPVISDEVLESITARIADAVALGVETGMKAAREASAPIVVNITTPDDPEVTMAAIAATSRRLGRQHKL